MRKLAINQLRDNPALSPEVVTQFVDKHRSPIIEGQRATFLFRGSADELFVRHRVVGLPDPLPMKQLPGTDLWAATCDLPAGSRVIMAPVAGSGSMPAWMTFVANPLLSFFVGFLAS